jgi:hypothetical protein
MARNAESMMVLKEGILKVVLGDRTKSCLLLGLFLKEV